MYKFDFCRFVFAPFGRYLGIKDVKPRKPPSNPKLEVAYKTSPRTKQVSYILFQYFTHFFTDSLFI